MLFKSAETFDMSARENRFYAKSRMTSAFPNCLHNKENLGINSVGKKVINF